MSWFTRLTQWVWGWFAPAKQANLLFLGLDNAGKTTLLHLMRDDKIIAHEPTRHPQQEEFQHGKVHIKAHDLGGHAAARRLWRQYFSDVHGVVFLIDTTDSARFDEARQELQQLLVDLPDIPFLVLGNKIDLAMGIHSAAQLQQVLGVDPSVEKHIHVQLCSIVKRYGITEGFNWLSKQIV